MSHSHFLYVGWAFICHDTVKIRYQERWTCPNAECTVNTVQPDTLCYCGVCGTMLAQVDVPVTGRRVGASVLQGIEDMGDRLMLVQTDDTLHQFAAFGQSNSVKPDLVDVYVLHDSNLGLGFLLEGSHSNYVDLFQFVQEGSLADFEEEFQPEREYLKRIYGAERVHTKAMCVNWRH